MVILKLLAVVCVVMAGYYLIDITTRRGIRKFFDYDLRQWEKERRTIARQHRKEIRRWRKEERKQLNTNNTTTR